jgi:glycosyltransferase involved in cell wall biosynthesis
MAPAVSVVIPTYNYGHFLAGALDSVLAQTFRDFDIVVVDDGSTDDTPEVMKPYLKLPFVKYVRTPHRACGCSAPKNTGVRESSGELLAFLDADDRWLPTKLEKQVALFRAGGPDLGVVYTRRSFIDPDGRPIPGKQRKALRGDVLAAMFHRPFVCWSSCMVPRRVFDDVGLTDESLRNSEDYDLWLRVGMKYRFDFVDEALVLYRTGHANMSRRVAERMVYVRRIIYRFLDERGGRERLPKSLVRHVLAEHFCDTAAAEGWSLKPRALAWYGRALALRPHHAQAWKALLIDSWKGPLGKVARRAGFRRPRGLPSNA